MNLKHDYDRIAQSALEEKKYIALDKWMAVHIPAYYVMLQSDEAGHCSQLQKWVAASTASNTKKF